MSKGSKRKSNQSNKNIIMIVGIVFVLCIAGFLIYTKLIHNDGEKGTFVDFSYYSDNYELRINSKNGGHPSGDAKFSVSSIIDDYEYEGKKYSALFDIEYYEIKEHIVNIDYPSIESYPTIEINNKTFWYIMNENDIQLIYQPDNLDCYVTLKVVLNNGTNEQLKISINDLSRKEITNNLKFELKKQG